MPIEKFTPCFCNYTSPKWTNTGSLLDVPNKVFIIKTMRVSGILTRSLLGCEGCNQAQVQTRPIKYLLLQ